jgi:hypothetical protein
VTPPDAAPTAVPGRPAGHVPGKKKARHKRLTRVATVLTLVGALAFGVALWFVVAGFLSRPSPEQTAIDGTKRNLAAIADDVRGFADARGRLPERLGELRAPDLPSRFDAEPWDRWKHPIEYRILDGDKRTFLVRSYGPDGRPDTADDLVWPEGARWN